MKFQYPFGMMLILAVLVWPRDTAAFAAELTIEEFQKYAAEKLPSFSESQLDALVKLVDKDGNGVISDAEFSDRLSALTQIAKPTTATQIAKPTTAPNRSADLKGEPVVIEPLTSTGEATVLLITADELAAAWKPFAEWKTQNGKVTKIITIWQIAQQYEAHTIQEKIRQCVRDHIEKHGTRWVVLGGDCLPNGRGLVPGGHTTIHDDEPEGIPTDLVFLSKTDWDADGDGIYGEWRDDREAISYPDGSVGLGRVPVRTTGDVTAFTEKVIAYESRYPATDFAQQMIYTCTDSPAYPKVRNSWDGYVSKVWKPGTARRFFSAETPWDEKGQPGGHDLNPENLIALINGRTAGKLHIHGHGHLPAWVLENSVFSAKHVARLKNEGAYPLITTVSCNTGEYDSPEDPSIVESMIRRPKGGSVAIVAPIRTGKAHFHDPSDFRLMILEGKLDGTTLTMTRYWSLGLGRSLTTGEALMQAKADLGRDAKKSAGYHLCICELNLLGDPTLDMRAHSPRTPSLTAPKSLPTGSQSVQIVTDALGSEVCLWKGKEVYAVRKTDDTGKATFEVKPASKGLLRATVYGASLNSVAVDVLIE